MKGSRLSFFQILRLRRGAAFTQDDMAGGIDWWKSGSRGLASPPVARPIGSDRVALSQLFNLLGAHAQMLLQNFCRVLA
jgi:hypothetical protein